MNFKSSWRSCMYAFVVNLVSFEVTYLSDSISVSSESLLGLEDDGLVGFCPFVEVVAGSGSESLSSSSRGSRTGPLEV